MTTAILPTRNEAWGFFGSIGRAEVAPAIIALEAWDIASRDIQQATEAEPEAVRAFLDSRQGRHFAGDVVNGVWAGETLQVSVELAKNRWMNWTNNTRTARDNGIPRGLPYLTGFVTQAGILAETD